MTRHIYLDQNIWIELSRARLKRPSTTQPFNDAYVLAQRAARLGLASFPLSRMHFYETQKQLNWDRRLDVVETMVELSKLHSISYVTKVVPLESDYAVAVILGKTPQTPNVFNSNLLGMSSEPSQTVKFPSGVRWVAAYRPSFAKLLDETGPDRAWEILTLAGPHPETERSCRDRTHLDAVDSQFPLGQGDVADIVVKLDLCGLPLATAIAQYALIEVQGELLSAARRAQLSGDAIAELIASSPMELLALLPSRFAVHAMYMQHAQRQRRWHPHDLHDFTALAVAAAYCDVTVTEKHWSTILRRQRVDEHFGHKIISSAADLVEVLAGL
ncbi:hypothetical protein [Mycobacterium sp.]|uniref:hypothetical protein n=1 Tax=Mycobacterium sp. TaxID=1785 RepID=UPI003F9EB1C5